MPPACSPLPPPHDSIHNPPHSAPVKPLSKSNSRRSQSRSRKEKYFGLIIEKDEEYFSDSIIVGEVTGDDNGNSKSPIGRNRIEISPTNNS